MWIIVDWQNEEDIVVVKDQLTNTTMRFNTFEDADRIRMELASKYHVYFNIVRL